MNPSPLIVIGLTGPAGSGKDTAAGMLTASHGFHRIALADAVKGAFDDLSGPTRQMHKELDGDHTQRRAWQLLGTEARESVGSTTLYADLLLSKVHYAWMLHPVPRRLFAVPDVSYQHESNRLALIIKAWGGIYETWRVCRDAGQPGLTEAERRHSSEHGRATIAADRHLVNSGTIADLHFRVGSMVAETLQQAGVTR